MNYKLCVRGHVRSPENVNTRGACKECVKILNGRWNGLKSEKRAEERKKNPSVTICKRGHLRTPENLYKNGTCKQCMSERKIDSEKKRAYEKAYRENNKDKCRKAQTRSIEKNPEKYKERQRKWRKNNPEKCKEHERRSIERGPGAKPARVRKRQAAKLKRTPPWLTSDHLRMIESLYHAAKLLTEKTGVQHHVDHIVPLQGRVVSGLHVPWNLQIIPWDENLKKGNGWTI